MAADLSILAEMRDISPLPASAVQVTAEALAALSVGLVLAMLIAGALRLFGARRKSRKQEALARLAVTRELPQDQRLFAQAKLLREMGEPTAPLHDALYRRDPAFDADALDAQIVRTLRAR